MDLVLGRSQLSLFLLVVSLLLFLLFLIFISLFFFLLLLLFSSDEPWLLSSDFVYQNMSVSQKLCFSISYVQQDTCLEGHPHLTPPLKLTMDKS